MIRSDGFQKDFGSIDAQQVATSVPILLREVCFASDYVLPWCGGRLKAKLIYHYIFSMTES